jgi:glycogen debranching enzyme
MSDNLFSGWGVRTMAASEGGYNPIEYHNGTVWPHDNSIVAAGLARHGYRDEAARIGVALVEAAAYFRHRLPEVFAGYPRERTKFPVEYPTASSPQAWATGTPLLVLRCLLGLEPRGDRLEVDPALPASIGELALRGIPGRWGRAEAVAERDFVA